MKKIENTTTYLKPEIAKEIVEQYNKIMNPNSSQYPQVLPSQNTPNFNLDLQQISPLKISGLKFSVSGNCN